MSTYLALDKQTGDLIKPDGGGVSRVDSGRFVVQQVQSKLRTFLDEWLLDPSIGYVGFGDFEKGKSRAELENRARVIILETEGVLTIKSMSSTYTGRVFNLQFSATTVYGVIELTVPWR